MDLVLQAFEYLRNAGFCRLHEDRGGREGEDLRDRGYGCLSLHPPQDHEVLGQSGRWTVTSAC